MKEISAAPVHGPVIDRVTAPRRQHESRPAALAAPRICARQCTIQ
jgi:hypothetical protein